MAEFRYALGRIVDSIRYLSEEDTRRLRMDLEKLEIFDQEPHGW